MFVFEWHQSAKSKGIRHLICIKNRCNQWKKTVNETRLRLANVFIGVSGDSVDTSKLTFIIQQLQVIVFVGVSGDSVDSNKLTFIVQQLPVIVFTGMSEDSVDTNKLTSIVEKLKVVVCTQVAVASLMQCVQ